MIPHSWVLIKDTGHRRSWCCSVCKLRRIYPSSITTRDSYLDPPALTEAGGCNIKKRIGDLKREISVREHEMKLLQLREKA